MIIILKTILTHEIIKDCCWWRWLTANDFTRPGYPLWMLKHLGHLISDPLQTQLATMWLHSWLRVLEETKVLPGLSPTKNCGTQQKTEAGKSDDYNIVRVERTAGSSSNPTCKEKTAISFHLGVLCIVNVCVCVCVCVCVKSLQSSPTLQPYGL